MSAPSTAAWPRPAHEDPALWVPARVPPGDWDRRPARLERCHFRRARCGHGLGSAPSNAVRTGARVRFPNTTSRFPDATSLTERTHRCARACPGHGAASGRDRRRSGDLTLFRSDLHDSLATCYTSKITQISCSRAQTTLPFVIAAPRSSTLLRTRVGTLWARNLSESSYRRRAIQEAWNSSCSGSPRLIDRACRPAVPTRSARGVALGRSVSGKYRTRGLVVFSRYCWTRSTIGMMAGGCASSMPSSSMTGPRYVRNSSNASWLSQTSKT